MCICYISTYPCSHTRTRVELCNKARATNLLRVGKPVVPCDNSKRKDEAPDLQDYCGSTCLTRPYKCNNCDSQRKQLTWRCADCNNMWNSSVLVWAPCHCPKHPCSEILLGSTMCKTCKEMCVSKGPKRNWTCHLCGSLNRSSLADVECVKCPHNHCSQCKTSPSE